MVAQEACLYMNAMEEAEEQMTSSDDWQIISSKAVVEDDTFGCGASRSSSQFLRPYPRPLSC